MLARQLLSYVSGGIMRQQQTIGRVMTCSGVGLHTGNPAMIKLCPAPPDTGVVFVRHEGGKRIALSASVGNLVPAELCTTISVNGLAVKTVEHVLSALAGLEVDNVFIELDNDEVPVMDGSAEPFVRLIQAAGVVPQDRPQPFKDYAAYRSCRWCKAYYGRTFFDDAGDLFYSIRSSADSATNVQL